MPVLPTALWDKFEEMADLLIEEVNISSIQLYFNTTVPVASTGMRPVGQFGELTYGGYDGFAAPINLESDRSSEGTPDFYRPDVIAERLKCRAYWTSDKFTDYERKLGLEKGKNYCKIITYVSDMSKLLNAAYAVVDGVRLTLFKPPFSRGLGRRLYTSSYWVETQGPIADVDFDDEDVANGAGNILSGGEGVDPLLYVVDWREVASAGLEVNYQLSALLVASGWSHYLFGGSDPVSPSVISWGADEVVFHRPFGQPSGTSNMDLAAFTQAQAVPHLANVVDVAVFTSGFTQFYQSWEKPITFYLGYPDGAGPPWSGLDDGDVAQLVEDNLVPFVALKSSLTAIGAPADTVRLAIDTWASKDPATWPDYQMYTIAYNTMVGAGFNIVAGEAWPNADFPYLTSGNVRYFAAEESISSWNPDETTTSTWAAYDSATSGIIIPVLTGNGGPYTSGQNIERATRRGQQFGAIAWQGWSTGTFPTANAIRSLV